MDSEMIKIDYGGERPTVNGRELHEALGISTAYEDWFPRMCEYGFVEGEDYSSFLGDRSDGLPGNPVTDHRLTIPMAKELCMIQHSDKGREFRKYFIGVEEKWNSPEEVMKRAVQVSSQQFESKDEWFELVKSLAAINDKLASQEVTEVVGKVMLRNFDLIEPIGYDYMMNPDLKNDEEMLSPTISSQSDFDECFTSLEGAATFEDMILADNRQHWKVTDIAKELYGTTADKFNKKLAKFGIQHRHQNAWRLNDEYTNKGYDTYLNSASVSGVSGMYWTPEGVIFLYHFLREKGILPLCEKQAAA